MNTLRGVQAVARSQHTSATMLARGSGSALGGLTRPTTFTPPTTITLRATPSSRSISLLSARRPILPSSSPFQPSSLNPSAATTPTTHSPETPDLLPKISAHPALGSTQVRCGPRDTYNPSHFVRKRRHGFLARIRTKKGRKLLMRRLKKGRWNLSH